MTSKRILRTAAVLALFALFSLPLSAQGTGGLSPGVRFVVVAPSGSCPAGSPIEKLINTTGTVYACQTISGGVGTWTALASSSASGTVTSVGPATGGGLVFSPNPITGSGTVSLLTNCSDGQVLGWSAGGSSWGCVNNTPALGTAAQLLVMNSGATAYAPVTMSQDGTISSTGVLTVTKTNNTAFGTFATQNYATPPAIGGTTPAAGTFSTLVGTTVNGLSLTALATGFSIAGGTTPKTLTISNTMTLAGTDSSTLNIGAGGTLNTGAFATIANYAPLAGATFTGGVTAPNVTDSALSTLNGVLYAGSSGLLAETAAGAADSIFMGNDAGAGSAAGFKAGPGSCSSSSNAVIYNASTHAWGCNTLSGSGTVNTGVAGQLAYYASSANIVSGDANATASNGTLTLGQANTAAGSAILEGATSGALTIATQAVAGTPTWTAGTSSGTPVVTTSSPLVITTATGNETCPTCVTSSGGGAMTGTTPIAVSAAGAISISGAAGQVPNGTTGAFTATPTLGASGTLGSVTMGNATSGTMTLEPAAGAITGTVLIPSGSDTIVNLTGTQTLTNKTLDGVTPTVMGYVDPTSSIQTQLNAKASSSAATTVNGQTCTLGSTCTVPFQTNSSGNTSQAGINLLTSTANSVGLTVTPTNSATNQEKFEVTGGSYTGNAATATKWATARNLAGNSTDGSANVAFANKFIVQGTTDAGLSGAQFLGALGTGPLKNTTSTGVLSIAAASDIFGLWSGSCSSSTYLNGAGTCTTPSGSGNVSNVGTPAQYQTGVWTGATTLEGIGPGTSGQAFLSGGASAYPAYGALNLAGGSSVVTGTLPVANFPVVDVPHGGTGANTLNDHSVLAGSATGAITTISVGGTGSVLIGTSASDPSFSPNLVLGSTTLGTGTIGMTGGTSGMVTIQPQAAAGTFNFNIPTTAGSSGYALHSAGGGASAMTWGLDANSTLSNLGTTAINAHLLPASSGSANLGSAALPFGYGYFANNVDVATTGCLTWGSSYDTALARSGVNVVDVTTNCAGGGVFGTFRAGSFTVMGATSGSAPITASATGGVLNLGSTNATVDPSGNATFAGTVGVGSALPTVCGTSAACMGMTAGALGTAGSVASQGAILLDSGTGKWNVALPSGSPFVSLMNYSAGTGLTASGGAISVTYGSTSGTAAQGNDSRFLVGANVQTSNYTALSTDNGKLVVMNCGSACAFTLPATAPAGWNARVMTVGSTNSTVSLNGTTFNGSASVPVLEKYRDTDFYSDGTNYWGRAPLVAGTNITLTPTANALTIAASGGGTPALSAVTGSAAATTGTEVAAGDVYTFAGVETANLTVPFVFTDANSTGNNSSGAMIIQTTGTSNAAVPLRINEANNAGDFLDFCRGCTVTNGILDPQQESGGALEAFVDNGGAFRTSGNGGFLGTAAGTNVVFQSGIDAATAIAGATATFRGADHTATTGSEQAGVVAVRGGNNNGTTSSANVKGGDVSVVGGLLNNASPGAAAVEGMTTYDVAYKGAGTLNTLACYNGTSQTIASCSSAANNKLWTGIIQQTAGGSQGVTELGDVLATFDASSTATAGDIVCVSTTTAGDVFDSGSTRCPDVMSYVGRVKYQASTGTTAIVTLDHNPQATTTTFLAMGPNPTALTSSMVIFGPTPMAQAMTVPANGANSLGTSQFILGTLPTATWTATLYKVAGSTAGCTGSATSMGTVAIATSGAQTWSTSATSFAIADCLKVVAPSSVDTTAANPTLSLVFVK